MAARTLRRTRPATQGDSIVPASPVIEPIGDSLGAVGGNADDLNESDYEPITAADPATLSPESGTEPDTGEPRKRRGRKPGSGNANREKESKSSSAEDLKDLLFSTHLMLHAALKVDELELEEAEAEKLAKALEKVSRFYKVSVLSPKMRAWLGLVTAAGTVYGPRLVSLYRKGMKGKPVIVSPIRQPQPQAQQPQAQQAQPKPQPQTIEGQPRAIRIPDPPIETDVQ